MGKKTEVEEPKPEPVQFGEPISGGAGAIRLVPRKKTKPKPKKEENKQ